MLSRKEVALLTPGVSSTSNLTHTLYLVSMATYCCRIRYGAVSEPRRNQFHVGSFRRASQPWALYTNKQKQQLYVRGSIRNQNIFLLSNSCTFLRKPRTDLWGPGRAVRYTPASRRRCEGSRRWCRPPRSSGCTSWSCGCCSQTTSAPPPHPRRCRSLSCSPCKRGGGDGRVSVGWVGGAVEGGARYARSADSLPRGAREPVHSSCCKLLQLDSEPGHTCVSGGRKSSP